MYVGSAADCAQDSLSAAARTRRRRGWFMAKGGWGLGKRGQSYHHAIIAGDALRRSIIDSELRGPLSIGMLSVRSPRASAKWADKP